ncbi:MAG: histidine phosphotransferase family protein [Pseudomonadota bacterium]
MIDLDHLSPADLSALLCSRICHDIVSPVGAINNGLELIEDIGPDEGAMDLIKTSAVNASSRLQFFRIAFGAAGSAGVQIDTGDAEKVATAWIKDEKPEMTWSCDRALLAKNRVKLMLNVLIVANASLPRGGEIDFKVEGALTETQTIAATATGRMAKVPAALSEMLGATSSEVQVDAHNVQFFYTLLLAREAGMTITVSQDENKVVIRAA